MIRSSVDLPEPERPSSATISPSAQIERDVVEHEQIARFARACEKTWRT